VQGLPYSLYLEPSRTPQEAAAVFASSWQFVCHVSDLPAPGTAARFDCAGRSAIVLRTRSGEIAIAMCSQVRQAFDQIAHSLSP